MGDLDAPIAPFYEGWQLYNERIVEVVAEMSEEQLAIRAAPDRYPVWAVVAHTAGARVYWLCGVFGEPGAESTPFPGVVTGEGWEDHLDVARTGDELVLALESSWDVVAGCLSRWTIDLLTEQFEPQRDKKTQVHTRRDVLIRLLSHDSYHCGELSQTLGIHGLTQIDLWRPE
jgi:uncharacterized damage-inducible protein DinB